MKILVANPNTSTSVTDKLVERIKELEEEVERLKGNP